MLEGNFTSGWSPKADVCRGRLRLDGRDPIREGIETGFGPRLQSLGLERIPRGQFVSGDSCAGREDAGRLRRLALDLAAVDIAQHSNVGEREGKAAGMTAFLLHQHVCLRVLTALVHQPQHVSARLLARMRKDRGRATPRDRDCVRGGGR